MKRLRLTLAALALTGLSHTAMADSGSSKGTFTKIFAADEAADYAKDLERSLASKGARIAIVFRTGRVREKLPEGVSYTHGGFWVYQPIQKADGEIVQGYVTYNLFHGDGGSLPKTQSYLATDFPYAFVADSAVEDLAVIIPTPEMQRRIFTMMADGRYDAMHRPDYSLISNPYDSKFQNCNEFMLDVIAAAAWETTDYAQIKSNLGAHFQSTRIQAGPLARLFGPMIDQRLKLSDHSGSPVRTVTYDSLSNFMLKFNLADESYVVTPSDLGELTPGES